MKRKSIQPAINPIPARKMVIGTGMLAHAFSAFKEDPLVCIFASGVSRSSERESSALTRIRSAFRSEQRSSSCLLQYV